MPPSPSAPDGRWPPGDQKTCFFRKREAGATYASMPMIGFTPVLAAEWKNSYAPNMLPWSLIAMAGMPCLSASANSLPFFAAPSSIEYSVWTCRCAKLSDTVRCSSG